MRKVDHSKSKEALRLASSLYAKACNHDQMQGKVMFAVFSEVNPYYQAYDRAMRLWQRRAAAEKANPKYMPDYIPLW